MSVEKAMGQPPLDTLMEHMDSRYSLVVAAAKRARAITMMDTENDNAGDEKPSLKPVTMALNEVGDGKVKFRRRKQGIK